MSQAAAQHRGNGAMESRRLLHFPAASKRLSNLYSNSGDPGNLYECYYLPGAPCPCFLSCLLSIPARVSVRANGQRGGAGGVRRGEGSRFRQEGKGKEGNRVHEKDRDETERKEGE